MSFRPSKTGYKKHINFTYILCIMAATIHKQK